MPYDANTPLMGRGVLSAADIDAAFSARGNDPAGFGALIVREADAVGLNHDFLAAQIGDESGWWTSKYALERNNPSGFGAVDNNPDNATFFPSIQAGVHATVAHWLTYIDGDSNPLSDDDPRFLLVPARNRGMIHTLGRIGNGVWASSTTYSATIARIMNELAPQPQPGGTMTTAQWLDGSEVPVPTTEDIGFPTRIHWAADYGDSRAIADIQWWVCHDTEGSAAGDEAVLTSANAPVESAHAYILKTGELVFMVPITVTAWHPGNDAVAVASIGVEQEGHVTTPFTDEQYRSMAAFFRWCQRLPGFTVPAAYIGRRDADGGPLPDDPGIIGHMDVPNPNVPGAWGGISGHTDPGPLYDFGRLTALISSGPAPAPQPDVLRVNGHVIGGAFRRLWESTPYSLQAFGLPLDDEHQETIVTPAADGVDAEATSTVRTVQRFERTIFAYFPELPVPWDVSAVTLTQIVGP